jgi:uncharacterized protein YgiM (DUF1202 family)
MKEILLLIFIVILSSCVSYSQDIKELEKNYYIVVGENVNIRTEPNQNSKIISRLDIARKVQIIKKSNTKVKIGDLDGEWVYIDSGIYGNKLGETVKGWIFDYYLAPVKEFKKINSICEFNIEGWVGDYLLSYAVNKSGTYKRKIYNYEQDKIRTDIDGEIFRFRNVLLAKDKNNTGYELFYFPEDNMVYSTYVDMKGKKICAKCK